MRVAHLIPASFEYFDDIKSEAFALVEAQNDLGMEVEAFTSTGAVARALIGSHLLYGLFLEEGTPRMAARPWKNPLSGRPAPAAAAWSVFRQVMNLWA